MATLSLQRKGEGVNILRYSGLIMSSAFDADDHSILCRIRLRDLQGDALILLGISPVKTIFNTPYYHGGNW